MAHPRRIATLAGTGLGIFVALALNAVLAHASRGAVAMEEFHQSYALNAGGRVALENINGPVHIATWDQNQVKVDAIKRASDDERLKNMEIRVSANPDSISIETHYLQSDNGWNDGDHHNPGSVEYTLTVPRTARLDEIKLINGSLDVTGVTGEVRAQCINGKLTARGLTGDAKLETINGHLDANFEKLPSTPIDLSSVNGTLEVTLPSDAKANIEATTVHGGIENDFGLHTNDHRFVGHDMRGELGGGGTRIHLTNVNGRIEVHHANDGRAMSPAKDLNSRDEGGDEI